MCIIQHADNPELDKQFPGISDKERLASIREANDWDFDIVSYSK